VTAANTGGDQSRRGSRERERALRPGTCHRGASPDPANASGIRPLEHVGQPSRASLRAAHRARSSRGPLPARPTSKFASRRSRDVAGRPQGGQSQGRPDVDHDGFDPAPRSVLAANSVFERSCFFGSRYCSVNAPITSALSSGMQQFDRSDAQKLVRPPAEHTLVRRAGRTQSSPSGHRSRRGRASARLTALSQASRWRMSASALICSAPGSGVRSASNCPCSCHHCAAQTPNAEQNLVQWRRFHPQWPLARRINGWRGNRQLEPGCGAASVEIGAPAAGQRGNQLSTGAPLELPCVRIRDEPGIVVTSTRKPRPSNST